LEGISLPVSTDPVISSSPGNRDMIGWTDVPRITSLRWLACILTTAAALRTMGLTYQLPVPAGPDYLMLVGAALRMGTGDLNPHMFTWPAAPFYFLAFCFGVMFLVCRGLGVVANPHDFERWFLEDPSAFFLVTRLIMVAVGLLSVVATYRIGCLLGSRRRGLWAAALLAVTPVEVIFCHYQKAEPLLVLTTLLALGAVIQWWQQDTPRRAASAGAAIGLACAVKYNAVLLVAPALATWIHHTWGTDRRQWIRSLIRRVAPGGLCLVAVFFALNPYLLLDAREALHQLAGQKQFLQAGDSPIHQTPVRSYLTVMFPVAFGWVLYVVYGVGLVWLAVAAVRRRGADTVLLVFVIVSAAALATQKLVTPYYPLPMVPPLALGAAGVFCAVHRRSRSAGWVVGALLLVPAGTSARLVYRLALPDPGFRAEYWIRDNIPAGDRLAHRHWLPPLVPSHRWRLGCYPFPQESRVRREWIEQSIRRGVMWFVLNPRDVAGREEELFGPDHAPLAREVRRFSAPHAYLPLTAEAVAIWKVSSPAEVPPLSEVFPPSGAPSPGRRLDVAFEGGILLTGTDAMEDRPIKPGEAVELGTYWHVPGEAPQHLLITGDLSGGGGYLADLTQELAYGITGFTNRVRGQPVVVRHRVLLRPGYRATPGDYTVRLGLRDAERGTDLPVVAGPEVGKRSCAIARVAVRR